MRSLEGLRVDWTAIARGGLRRKLDVILDRQIECEKEV